MAGDSACPVCLQAFATPSKFALHVADCLSLQPLPSVLLPPPPPPAKVTSCPICHMVYTSDLTAHHIEFHEEECEDRNAKTEPAVPASTSSNKPPRIASGAKRSREDTAIVVATPASSTNSTSTAKPPSSSSSTSTASTTTTAVVATRGVQLFPSFCAVCDSAGRTLLKCAGKCARSFHPLCVEDINARDVSSVPRSTPPPLSSDTATVGFATAISRNKKVFKEWVCGDCERGLHPCQLCGFLGHEAHELIQCSLPDCGFFFHPKCLREQNHRVRLPLVCPRHTCTSCHAIETDLTNCVSCTKCCTAQHIHCRDASTATTSSRSRGDASDTNFYVCESHKPPSETKEQAALRIMRQKYSNFTALRMNVRAGDVVLILEYNNLLLPDTAKEAAPQTFNHWGIVQAVEQLGHGVSPAWWAQLLRVQLFADKSNIDVPNRYVLPVSSMRQHNNPVKMIREAIRWHTMTETRLRELESGHDNIADRTAIISSAMEAFKGQADATGVRPSERKEEANAGLDAWEAFASAVRKTQLSTGAPVFLSLDTRGHTKHHDIDMDQTAPLDTSPSRGKNADKDTSPDGDNDVDMEGGDSGEDAESSSPSTGKSQAPAFTAHHLQKVIALVEDEVIVAVARLLESVVAHSQRGRLLGGASTDESMNGDAHAAENSDEDMGDGSIHPSGLAIDDLLNPSSQDAFLSPVLAPQRHDNYSDLEETKESGTPKSSDPTSYRLLDPSSEEEEETNEADDSLRLISTEPPAKKPKLQHTARPPINVQFKHLPVDVKQPRSSVFVRGPDPSPAPLLRRQILKAQMPSVIVDELEMQVDAFFSAEDGGDDGYPVPAVRPAFYRPSPFLYRGPRVGRRVDGISTVLLCQDKRDLKCFVREATKAQLVSGSSSSSRRQKPCPYGAPATGTRLCVTVDLLGIPSFAVLESVIRGRVSNVLPEVSEASTSPELLLSYCAYDGSEHVLPSLRARAQQRKQLQQPEWLCFCANVVHLTATLVQP